LTYFRVPANNLTGPIPDVSGLSNLIALNVGSNHLGGALPTAPNGLVDTVSTLCPNDFPDSSYVDDAPWDAATGVSPWFTLCDEIFYDGFELQ
jgi:hypothetical protein